MLAPYIQIEKQTSKENGKMHHFPCEFRERQLGSGAIKQQGEKDSKLESVYIRVLCNPM